MTESCWYPLVYNARILNNMCILIILPYHVCDFHWKEYAKQGSSLQTILPILIPSHDKVWGLYIFLSHYCCSTLFYFLHAHRIIFCALFSRFVVRFVVITFSPMFFSVESSTRYSVILSTYSNSRVPRTWISEYEKHYFMTYSRRQCVLVMIIILHTWIHHRHLQFYFPRSYVNIFLALMHVGPRQAERKGDLFFLL